MGNLDWQTWNNFNDPIVGAAKWNGNIYVFIENCKLYIIDESVALSNTLVATLTYPGGSVILGTGMVLFKDCLYMLAQLVMPGPVQHTIVYRLTSDHNLEVACCTLDGTGGFTDINSVATYWIGANVWGLIIGGYTNDGGFQKPQLIGTYDGYTWFEAYRRNTWPDWYIRVWAGYDRFIVKCNVAATFNISAQYSFGTWAEYSPNMELVQPQGKYILGWLGGDDDQWLITADYGITYSDWYNDTNFGEGQWVEAYRGRWWSAGRGLRTCGYYDVHAVAWVEDKRTPVDPQLPYRWLVVGYTGYLFDICNSFDGMSDYYRVYKRINKGAGATRSSGKGSFKLSIDRDSGHIYCTTFGVDTGTPDYWRVINDLSTVALIDSSTISGVFAGVHSPAVNSVYCFGNIDGDLVRYSTDNYTTFLGYEMPSGIDTEATTLYSLRDNGLPLDIVVTVTVSGLANSDIYTHPSGNWLFMSHGNLSAVSQVRRDIHTFIGAFEPTSGIVVDYSTDKGINWEERDYDLPVVTITDLEFA